MRQSAPAAILGITLFGAGLLLWLGHDGQAQAQTIDTECSSDNSCESGCQPQPTGSQIPSSQHIVCTHSSVTALGNPDLQAAINIMTATWNAIFLANDNVTFSTGSSNCTILVRAMSLTGIDGTAGFTAVGGVIDINSNFAGSWSREFAQAVMNHEMGHLVGLDEVTNCQQGSGCLTQTIMCSPLPAGSTVTCTPTSCDTEVVDQNYGSGGSGGGEEEQPEGTTGCGTSSGCSPILLAVGQSSEYKLTGAGDGVLFDIDADGAVEQVGWTVAGEPLGFLALDRNHNSVIDSGRELFGNYTPLEGDQTAAQGFEALAHWDSPAAGGNGDGWISSEDAVWADLWIWIDGNHDGFTQPGELVHPTIFSISGISLDYRTEGRRDQHGNFYRLTSEFQIGPARRQCYDVFLTTE